MKELNVTEVKNVSGGDFDFKVTLFVPSNVGGQFSNYFQQLVVGQIPDTNALITNINDAITNGMNVDNIRVESIEYINMN